MNDSVTRQEYEELRGRVTLLEGGCTETLATKDDLKNLNLDKFKDSLTQLIDSSGADTYVSKELFNKLVSYLVSWVGAGNLNMRDLPTKLESN